MYTPNTTTHSATSNARRSGRHPDELRAANHGPSPTASRTVTPPVRANSPYPTRHETVTRRKVLPTSAEGLSRLLKPYDAPAPADNAFPHNDARVYLKQALFGRQEQCFRNGDGRTSAPQKLFRAYKNRPNALAKRHRAPIETTKHAQEPTTAPGQIRTKRRPSVGAAGDPVRVQRKREIRAYYKARP
jgi:hypothetical protein